jgi:Peptidase family M28
MKSRTLMFRPKSGVILSLVISAILIPSPQRPTAGAEPSPEWRAALDRVSADSLRGNLSFLASDLLEGRDTPSKGLDIAAEYIAAQFRRAGLEPGGDNGYFQSARWIQLERPKDPFDCRIEIGGQTISLTAAQVSFPFEGALDLARAGMVKLDYADKEGLAALTAEQIGGRVVLAEIPDFRREDRSRWGDLLRARVQFFSRMMELKAALVVSVDRVNPVASGIDPGRLVDPERPLAPPATSQVPLITVHHPAAVKLYDESKPGPLASQFTIRAAAPIEKQITLRNVVGVLRGSDPVLKDTYVLVTAHYDHIGVRPGAAGDSIFNGANDDGSGTVSVIELASALSSLKTRPKRSLVFMTFFGEEKGLLGSRYYGRHPIFPLKETVADINLEQVGRTDSTEGPQLANATMTGFDYSDVGTVFKAAGEQTGITLYKHERNSDLYFGRSDNQALADRGVPAHTLCVAFDYPDYHGAGDHWDKIDYDNMAKVDRMVALGLLMIADSTSEPKWNADNPKVARYAKASQENRGR